MAIIDVPQYGIYDFSLHSDAQYDNPFMVELSAMLEHESGEKIELEHPR